jgi:hypothetical protein
MLKKQTRDRLLAVARVFDRWAAGIRAYVKEQTPKRSKAEASS